jgi:putative DNA primase/helicase
MLLGVANGIIDLRTGTLRDGKPKDKITLHSDIVYDPEAQCPRFTDFINEVFGGDRDLIEFVHRAIGYCLTGDTREQCKAPR